MLPIFYPVQLTFLSYSVILEIPQKLLSLSPAVWTEKECMSWKSGKSVASQMRDEELLKHSDEEAVDIQDISEQKDFLSV